MFTIVNVAGVAFRIPILHYLEPIMLGFFRTGLHLSRFTPEFAARNSTLALAVGIVMLWNFFINRHWTYSDID